MAKFQFRFESLLSLRRMARDERAAALGQAMEARNKLQGWIDELKAEIDQIKRSRMGVGVLDADQILASASYEASLRSILAGYESDLLKVDEEVERRREALTVADQAVRVLEKLRERKHEQHQQALLELEAKVLDEVATAGTVRRAITSPDEA
jgi:flagellar FliJ protein